MRQYKKKKIICEICRRPHLVRENNIQKKYCDICRKDHRKMDRFYYKKRKEKKTSSNIGYTNEEDNK